MVECNVSSRALFSLGPRTLLTIWLKLNFQQKKGWHFIEAWNCFCLNQIVHSGWSHAAINNYFHRNPPSVFAIYCRMWERLFDVFIILCISIQCRKWKQMVWCLLVCIACLTIFVMHQHPLQKKMEKKLMRACLHHILCQKLSVRDAVYFETTLESNSGSPAPPFWSGRYIVKWYEKMFPSSKREEHNIASFCVHNLHHASLKGWLVIT